MEKIYVSKDLKKTAKIKNLPFSSRLKIQIGNGLDWKDDDWNRKDFIGYSEIKYAEYRIEMILGQDFIQVPNV